MKKNNVLILVLINLFLPGIFILSMNFSIVGTNNNLTPFSMLMSKS